MTTHERLNALLDLIPYADARIEGRRAFATLMFDTFGHGLAYSRAVSRLRTTQAAKLRIMRMAMNQADKLKIELYEKIQKAANQAVNQV